MIVGGFVAGIAWGAGEASPPTVSNVVQPVGEGVWVDWTDLRLNVHGSAASAHQGLRSVEERARREVDATLRQALGRLPVAPQVTLGQLLADHPDGRALRARAARWVVHDATYGTSGRVWLAAHVSLHDVLKPWLLAHAGDHGRPAPSTGECSATGVLVDARTLSFQPAYAPVLLGPEGAIVFNATLDSDAAVSEPPVRYVPDPAHPAAARVGEQPLIVLPTRASGSTLVLDALDGAAMTACARLLRRGGLVVAVDVD